MFEHVMEYYDKYCHQDVPTLQYILMRNNIDFFDENLSSYDKRTLPYLMNRIDRCNTDDDRQIAISLFNESVIDITFAESCFRSDLFTMIGMSLCERPFYLYGYEYTMPNVELYKKVRNWLTSFFNCSTDTLSQYLKSDILVLFIKVIYHGGYIPSKLFDHIKIINDLNFQFGLMTSYSTTSSFHKSIYHKIILNYCNSLYYKSETTMGDVLRSIREHSSHEVADIKNVPELIQLYDTLMSRSE